MRILHSLKSLFEMAPRNRVTVVSVNAYKIECQWRKGSKESVNLGEIQRVFIRTTNKGPFDDDVFFVLETFDKNYVIPQQVAVVGALLEHLQQLPGFDNEAVIEAMGCTENRDFCCWERE